MTDKALTCPNCLGPVVNHPQDGCVLAVLIGVLRDRGTKTEEELHALHAGVDADLLWNDIGEILDRIEDGDYVE